MLVLIWLLCICNYGIRCLLLGNVVLLRNDRCLRKWVRLGCVFGLLWLFVVICS